MRKTRPETGACDALSHTYFDGMKPCSCLAKYIIDGKHLCVKHAKGLAFDLARKSGVAVPIPSAIRSEGVQFIPKEQP